MRATWLIISWRPFQVLTSHRVRRKRASLILQSSRKYEMHVISHQDRYPSFRHILAITIHIEQAHPSVISVHIENTKTNLKMTTMSLLSSSALPLVLVRPRNLTRRLLWVTRATPQCRLARNGNQCLRSNFRLMSLAAGRSTEKVGVPASVPVRVAYELLQAGHRYLDVRTPEEFSAGHAVGAVNVPYMLRAGDGMTKNHNFLEEVSQHFGKDSEIIVGCKIGKRSLMAATELCAAGYSGITDIAGGYSAWIENGLPTE